MVRAKFRVTERTEKDNNGFTVVLFPVTSGSEENKQFYKWTPGGTITLSTINEEAAAQFIVGKEYYVDFTQSPIPLAA